MRVNGESLDKNWLLQYILSVWIIISLVFLSVKKIVSSSFNTHEVDQSSEAWEGGHSLCSFCGYFRTITSCSLCKTAEYCSGFCLHLHRSYGHQYECIETKMATDQKEISCTANDERAQTGIDKQTAMPGDIYSHDGLSFSMEEFALFFGSSPEEGTTNTNPKPSIESSECNNWVPQTSFVSSRLNTFMKEYDQHQVMITEEPRVAKKREEDHIQMLESECSEAKKELQEERERVQRLILEQGEIKQILTRMLEKTGVAERKKLEKYFQMLEIAEDARVLEMMPQEEPNQTMKLYGSWAFGNVRSEWAKVERKEEEAQGYYIQTLLKSECAKMMRELQEERKLVQRLKLEEIAQELVDARNDAEYATSRADVAQSECAKMKGELQEERKLVQRLKLKQDEAQIAKRKLEDIAQELANARNDVEYATSRADVAENERIKAKRQLEEEREFVQLLKQECDDTRQTAMRQVEDKELELANALNAAAYAESRAAAAETCAICLTNDKDMAFGCGHMTCEDCGSIMSTCPICREQITSRLRLFPG